jgi:hypothetical protein
MGDIVTASGTRVYISGTALASTIDTVLEFAAVSTWTEIGLVESVGEFGDESSAITFEALGDGRVRKAKGAADAGTMAIVVAHDPTDLGQAAIELAQQNNDNYGFKVVLPDSPVGYSDTILYFRGLVMGRRKNVGNNANVIRNTYNVGINSPIYADPAST